jgi:low affinity Fe/Cu permease
MERIFETIAANVASWTGRPPAFILALAVIIVWGVTGPIFHYSDTWQLVINTSTTIVTFLMVFLIQNSQNRDAAAMQAKLDELIRAITEARGQFIGIEHRTDKEIQEIRALLEEECAEEEEVNPHKPNSNTYLERLLSRR